MLFEWFVGVRYLKAKKRQAFISLITFISTGGVCLGVMTLIIVLSVMNGFETNLREKILGTHSHIIITDTQDKGIRNYNILLEKIKKIPSVVSGSPFLYGQVMLRSQRNTFGAEIYGIDIESEKKVTNIVSNIKYGTLNFNLGNTSSLIIGVELAKQLEVGLEETISVITPIFTQTAVGVVPRAQEFKIAGIFQTGKYDYDASIIYVSLKAMQELFNLDDVVTGIAVKVDNIFKVKKIAFSISNNLGKNYKVRNWIELNRNIFAALKTEKIVMFILLTLIIFVAAFNIISNLIMIVMEKTREIGILKSMGVADKSIMHIFIIQGLIIGMIGTFLGTILGIVGCGIIAMFQIPIPGSGEVYYIDTLPVKIDMQQILIVIFCAIFLCLISTIYPALYASNLKPIDALKYE